MYHPIVRVHDKCLKMPAIQAVCSSCHRQPRVVHAPETAPGLYCRHCCPICAPERPGFLARFRWLFGSA